MSTSTPVIFSHSRHKLRVSGCKATLDVLSFDGEEALSQPFKYSIQFTSSDLDIAAEDIVQHWADFSFHSAPLTKLESTRIRPGVGPLRSLYGTITRFKRVSASVEEARYEVVLEPRLALLSRGRQYRIFQNQSVPEIVTAILRNHNGFDPCEYEFVLCHQYPPREQVMQYGESDLAFICRLLAEVGIWYRFGGLDDIRIGVVHFHDHQRHLQWGVTLPARPLGGFTTEQDAVWDLQTQHNVVEKQVSVRAYNPLEANADLDQQVDKTRGDDPTTYSEAYHYGEPYTVLGDHHVLVEDLVPESGEFFARIRHERYLNQRTCLNGSSSSATLAPGQVLEISGGAPKAFLPCCVITRINTRAARDHSLEVRFEAMAYSNTICFRPPALPKPQIAGTLPARITSRDKVPVYAHLHLDGRYRVQFLFDRDTWDKGQESLWLRLARPYAGKSHGLHLPLLAGTEVAVAFEQGDPDRPYIAHALHDSEHPDHVDYRNRHRNVLRTPANNKLRMDDTRGEEHVKLSTEHSGKSQLNLGHVVDHQKLKRGDGFELRTDTHGAIRAGGGLFLSAEKQPLADGKVLEMRAAIDRLTVASEQLQSLSDNAEAAKAEPADVQAQIALIKDQLEQLRGAVALISAPEGIALASGKHLQLMAKANLMLNAGGHADIGVVKRLFMGIGQGLSLFVNKVGIKLIANQGPVTVQAQNDTLEIFARNGLQITSSEDEIHITAKKKIVLNGGGSYFTLEKGLLESGTDGDYQIKAPRFNFTGSGASLTAAHPSYLPSELKQPLRLKVPRAPNTAGNGLAGMPYSLYADGQLLQQGVLDASAYVSVAHQVVTQAYRLQLANGVSYQIPVPGEYRNAEQAELANRGVHNHPVTSADGVAAATAHTEHRLLYGALIDATNNKEISKS
jgi:type VI secretion system secreted protein VgrG